ncbi:MAG: LytTR family DNA-binding domain-containing protein [Oscillospiraceae bacterium]|nr:LytTR family DNA-binding domain-containing protein [Oscillospiraceae bacterium]
MKIAVCDDELEISTKCADFVTQLAKKHDLSVDVQVYSTGEALLFDMEDVARRPDLLYLDINMPGMKGIEVADTLQANGAETAVIFLTVSKAHMLQAFDVHAFHYLVKEDTDERRFEKIFLDAAARIQKKKQEVITVSCAGESRIIPVEDIRYFEVKDYILTVYYQNESFEFYSTLGKVEEALLGHGFLRIHRSFLVAKSSIRKVSRKEVELAGGVTLPVGRSYWDTIKTATGS